MKYKAVIYDYDGTLSDPCGSITDTLNEVYFEFSGKTLSESQLLGYVGPPLVDIFHELLDESSEEDIDRAVKLYRHKYNTENHKKSQLYSGIMDVLQLFQSRNIPQFIATAKKQETIDMVCEYQHLNQFFIEINGLGTYKTKTDIVFGILERNNLLPEQCCLVGDRNSDMKAAKDTGVAAVGALWGFGGEEELLAAGADLLLCSPSEIASLL